MIRHFFNKNNYAYIMLLALLTAFASEIKLIPFNEESIRFGLGSIIFLLFILIRVPHSLLKAGIFTGIIVTVFRIYIDMSIYQASFVNSFMEHIPAAAFYIFFALGLQLVNIEKFKRSPLLLGVIVTGLEFAGNSMEHFVRFLFIDGFHFSVMEWLLLCGAAFIRSYFVVGLYSSITISEHRKQMSKLLDVGTELYAETLYLQKSMDHIETITASGHDLYRKLQKENKLSLSVQALHITQEIHEVKKDAQRIYAGLSNITDQQKRYSFHMSELMDFVISSNKKYSTTLHKDIEFQLAQSIDFETAQHIPFLALLNNVTANAVESIVDKGIITLDVSEKSGVLFIQIHDSGSGIPKDEVDVIFEPGYTTKFNDKGVAATGIGLSHVNEIVHALHGKIHLHSSDVGTLFQISIPTKHIRKDV